MEMDYPTAVGLGLIPNQTRVAALGHNPDIPVGGAEDVWEGGGNYPFLAAAAQLEVVSTSASDTALGTGARTVLVSGLDANYEVISEVVTLNGLTPVLTTREYLRINVFTTTSSGSGEVNAGDITLRVAGGGAIQSIARAGYGFGRSAVFTVPAGFTLFIKSFLFTVIPPSGATINIATFGILQRSNTGNRRIALEIPVTSESPYRHDTQLGVTLSQRTDVVLRVTLAGQNGTNVTSAFEGILVSNAALL